MVYEIKAFEKRMHRGMDRQKRKSTVLDIPLDEDASFFNFHMAETQRSLKEKFNRLQLASTQTSKSIKETTMKPSDCLNNSLSFMNMDSTLNETKSLIPMSENENWDIQNLTKATGHGPFEKNDCWFDMSCPFEFRLNFNSGNHKIKKKLKAEAKSKYQQFPKRIEFNDRMPLCQRNRQEQLRQMRVVLEKERIELLELQLAQLHMQMQYEERMINKKIYLHKMELEILQRSAAKY